MTRPVSECRRRWRTLRRATGARRRPARPPTGRAAGLAVRRPAGRVPRPDGARGLPADGPGGGPSPTWYPLGYALKVVAVAGPALACRSTWRDLRAAAPAVGPGAGGRLGLVVTAVWVGLDGLYPALPFLGGKRTAFDPTDAAARRAGRASWPSGCSAWSCSSR